MTHGPSSATVGYPKLGRTRAYMGKAGKPHYNSYNFDSKFNVLSLYSRSTFYPNLTVLDADEKEILWFWSISLQHE
jgi:hypothetical protein